MNYMGRQVEERPANWLPLPGEGEQPVRHHAVVDEDDFFAKATVASYHSLQGEGIIRTAKGGMIPFNVAEGALIGDPGHIEPGMTVGYDASVTSHGMRVIALKVY